MTELKMDCMGSVILYSQDDSYCVQCPLRVECEMAVARNRVELQEALGRPVYQPEGQFWRKSAMVTQQRRSLAMQLSSPTPVEPIKPKSTPAPKLAATPAAKKPELKAVIAAVVTAPPSKMTPHDALTAAGDNLQKKVRERLTIWVKKGVDPSSVVLGVNPFSTIDRASSDSLVTEALLKLGVVGKKTLKAEVFAIQTAAGIDLWSDGTAQSQINIITGAYAACGYQLITE